MLKDDILNVFNFQQCCCLHKAVTTDVSFNIRCFAHTACVLIYFPFALLGMHHFCGACCSWTSSADELFLEWSASATIFS